jgi:hypothetical protein
MPLPITTFKLHYSAKYRCSIGKIALDAGVVCPNRARGGCVYCSAQSFKPYYIEAGDGIAVQLKKGKLFLTKRGFEKYFAYFQQETTTAAPTAFLMPLLSLPLADESCVGLIISTRPDCLEEEFLFNCRRCRSPAARKSSWNWDCSPLMI